MTDAERLQAIAEGREASKALEAMIMETRREIIANARAGLVAGVLDAEEKLTALRRASESVCNATISLEYAAL